MHVGAAVLDALHALDRPGVELVAPDQSEERRRLVEVRDHRARRDAASVTQLDTGFADLFGYSSHYCTADNPDNAQYVACSYFEAGVKAWDIAAGVLIVREAGGRVCDFRGRGERLLDGGQIVAGNLKLCDALQKAVVSSGYASAFA